jgi:hypothetical protein
VSAKTSTTSKRTRRTRSSKQILSKIRSDAFEVLVKVHVTLLNMTVMWARADPHSSKLPSSEFADRIAHTSATCLEGYLHACPAEYRTLIAAEVLCSVFKKCISAAKRNAPALRRRP